MKCCFLRLQISDHRLNPINRDLIARDLIANGQEYSPVMFNLFIEFVALFAHGNPSPTNQRLLDCRLKVVPEPAEVRWIHDVFGNCLTLVDFGLKCELLEFDAADLLTPAQSDSVIGTPLRIPYGNKDVAMKLGARYGSAGWYAPPGADLSAFGERGWL
jgi:hypothetical protein